MRVGDDESNAIGRFLIPPLNQLEAEPFIETHLQTSGYALPPDQQTEVGTVKREFHTNDTLWESILYNQVPAGTVVALNSFFIFEWLPRAPGLYFTHDGYFGVISKSCGRPRQLKRPF